MKIIITLLSMLIAAQVYAQHGTFKAPAIYSLKIEKTSPYQPTTNRTDSVMAGKQKNDSLLYRKLDTLQQQLAAQQLTAQRSVTPMDTSVRQELTGIRTELKEMKRYFYTQSHQTREQQLLYQEDSIRRLKMRLLAAYPISKSDYRELHVYDLQLDSIQRRRTLLEMEGVHTDSGWTTADHSWTSLHDSLITAYDTTIINTRQPYRDTSARSYRDTSLRTYRDTSASAYQPDLPPSPQTDSLRQVIATRDSGLTELRNRLSTANDTLTKLQTRLRQTTDSAQYYQTTAAAARDKQTTDSLAQQKKWYEQPFSLHKRRPAPAAAPDPSLEKAQYYTDTTTRLQTQIDALKQNYQQLQHNYDQLLQQRQNTPSRLEVPQSSISVYPPTSDNQRRDEYRYDAPGNDRRDRRVIEAEIAALNIQLARASVRNNNPSTIVVPVPAGSAERITSHDTTLIIRQDSVPMAQLQQQLDFLHQRLDSMQRTMPANDPSPRETKPAAQTTNIENYPVVSLYFAANATSLDPQEVEKLAPIAQTAQKQNNIHLNLKASTDPVGSRAANTAIAGKRTNYVRTLLLQQYGLAPEMITVLDPLIRTKGSSTKANPLDRRVDIKLSR